MNWPALFTTPRSLLLFRRLDDQTEAINSACCLSFATGLDSSYLSWAMFALIGEELLLSRERAREPLHRLLNLLLVFENLRSLLSLSATASTIVIGPHSSICDFYVVFAIDDRSESIG